MLLRPASQTAIARRTAVRTHVCIMCYHIIIIVHASMSDFSGHVPDVQPRLATGLQHGSVWRRRVKSMKASALTDQLEVVLVA